MLGRSDVPHSSDDLTVILPLPPMMRCRSLVSPGPPTESPAQALWKGASGPMWDVIIHPAMLPLGRSWALSPTDHMSGTAANPGSLAGQQAMLIALWTVGPVCIYANWGLISSSPRWVSSGLSLPSALPGLKASLANGTNAHPDGGLSRQNGLWP